MPDVRLILKAQDESPAWAIPLEDGQEYIGRDDREDGTTSLILDLGDQTYPTSEQVEFLCNCQQVVSWTVAPPYAAPEIRPHVTYGEVFGDLIAYRISLGLPAYKGDVL